MYVYNQRSSIKNAEKRNFTLEKEIDIYRNIIDTSTQLYPLLLTTRWDEYLMVIVSKLDEDELELIWDFFSRVILLKEWSHNFNFMLGNTINKEELRKEIKRQLEFIRKPSFTTVWRKF